MDKNHFALRITREWSALETFNKLKGILDTPLKKILDDYALFTAFEISKTGVLHSHSYIITQLSMETLRTRLSKLGLKGNEDLSLSTVRDHSACINYTAKCKDYVSTGNFPLELLDSIKEWVWPEELKETFDEDIKEITKKYLTTDVSDTDFLEEALLIYAQNNRKIYVAQIRAWWLGLANRRNKLIKDDMRPLHTLTARERICRSIMDRI